MSDFLQIDNFNIEQLDSDGKEVLDEFEKRFIELRKKLATIPPEFYQMATDFHKASCRAQTEVQKITMQHFAAEWGKDQKLGCELDAIQNWQTRKATKKAFIQEQRRLKKPLPWRYDFWGNLVRAIQSFIVMFIPPQVVRLFTRKGTITIPPKPPETPQEAPKTPAHKQSTKAKKPATGARVPASAVVAANAVVQTDTKPKPTPATPTAKVLVSRRSVKLNKEESL